MTDGITARQSFVSACIKGCPRQAYLSYVKHLPYKRSGALFLGSTFHSTFEQYHKLRIGVIGKDGNVVIPGRYPSLTEVIEIFSKIFKDTWDPDLKLNDSESAQTLFDTGIHLCRSYFPTAEKTEAAELEKTAILDVLDYRTGLTHHVTTAIDIWTKDEHIIEEKSARVYKRARSNIEYFPDYTDDEVRILPQPKIHKLAFGNRTYHYNVVGKGEQELVGIIPVLMSNTALSLWKDNVLIPVLDTMHKGNFPARMDWWCKGCEWNTDRMNCGAMVQ